MGIDLFKRSIKLVPGTFSDVQQGEIMKIIPASFWNVGFHWGGSLWEIMGIWVHFKLKRKASKVDYRICYSEQHSNWLHTGRKKRKEKKSQPLKKLHCTNLNSFREGNNSCKNKLMQKQSNSNSLITDSSIYYIYPSKCNKWEFGASSTIHNCHSGISASAFTCSKTGDTRSSRPHRNCWSIDSVPG